ncbi:MAG: RNA degradosome polyphosphate kinase [Acidimicrobiales bacterium]
MADQDDLAPYLNRELSLLDFQERVLSLAEDPDTPLLERAKFLAIFSTNIDEFFQVRVAVLRDRVAAGLRTNTPDGLSPREQLYAIAHRVRLLVERQSRCFADQVVPELAAAAISLTSWTSLDHDDRAHVTAIFDDMFPVLTPLAVDPGHPFPYISSLSLNLGIIVSDPVTAMRRFARVKVPPVLPRFVFLPDGKRFVPLEQVIAAHLDRLFPGMEIESHHHFRVTRSADLTLEEDEADDLLAAVEMELRRRRFGRAVRLEIDPAMSVEMRTMLAREMELDDDDGVFAVPGPLDLGGLWSVWELARPELKDDPWVSATQSGLADADDEPADIFATMRQRDILVHHPYDSFRTSVEAFIQQAAADPRVLAIKQTLYRTSGHSPIVEALIGAAEQGKQVAALVELKAQFDEQANIAWARKLEQAGAHVVYGLVGFKTHSKTALVVRQDDDGIRRYCHVGTGNYNSRTARVYEDIGLLSCDPALGAELSELFNYLTGFSRQTGYEKLLVAPTDLRDHVIAMIEQEAADPDPGRIVMKLNGLVDQAVIDALYKASSAGVPIDLIVRSVCCLRPGVPGLSENIRVRSILGRYLEHSRILAFGNGRARPVQYLIGSADMMPRNLDRRIEVLVPVEAPTLQARLQEVLDICLADDVQSWALRPDGSWAKVATTAGVSTHARLQQLAIERDRLRRGVTGQMTAVNP